MAFVSDASPLAPARRRAQELAAAGDLAGARELLDKAVELGRANLAEDDPDVLLTACHLGRVYQRLDDHAAARRVLEEAYAAGQWRLGDHDPLMVEISHDIGVVAEELGNRHEARKAFTRVAEYGPAALGTNHEAVARAQTYLGHAPDSVRSQPPTAEPGRPQPNLTLVTPVPSGPPFGEPATVPPPGEGGRGPGRPPSGAEPGGMPAPRRSPEGVDEPTVVQPVIKPRGDAAYGNRAEPAAPQPVHWQAPQPRTSAESREVGLSPAGPPPSPAGPVASPVQGASSVPLSRAAPATPSAPGDPAVPFAQSGPAVPVAQSGSAVPVAQNGPAMPVAQSGPAVPVARGGSVVPFAQGSAAAPFAQGNAATPFAQGNAATPFAQGNAATPFALGGAPVPFSRSGSVMPVGQGAPAGSLAQGAPFASRSYGAPAISGVGPAGGDTAYRKRGVTLFAAIAAVLASIIAVAALVFVLANRGKENGSATASNVPTLAGAPPTGLRLRDRGAEIEITWKDPTAGTVSFMIVMAHPGEELKPMATLGPGKTSYRAGGLSTRLNYCFAVVAVYRANQFATSPQSCTSRGSAGPGSSTGK